MLIYKYKFFFSHLLVYELHWCFQAYMSFKIAGPNDLLWASILSLSLLKTHNYPTVTFKAKRITETVSPVQRSNLILNMDSSITLKNNIMECSKCLLKSIFIGLHSFVQINSIGCIFNILLFIELKILSIF